MPLMLLFSISCGTFLLLYLISRLTKGITRSATCLIGKTAIVTGANSGLGYQIALNLASRGCKVIMADIADMEKSKTDIIQFTGNNNIVSKKMDLSSFESVRNFAYDIIKTEKRIDLLFNNAGLIVADEENTIDGLNPLMQINYFGHFLLTHLLIDVLKKSAPSRIIFTSSFASFTNNLTLDNLALNSSTNFWGKWCLYSNSKLAMIIASDIFAKKLRGTGITSNCAYPGVVATPIFVTGFSKHKNPLLAFVIKCFVFLFGKSAWEGSQTMVHLGVSKKAGHITGAFFADCVKVFKPLKAYNEDFCKKVWKASEKYVKLEPNEKF